MTELEVFQEVLNRVFQQFLTRPNEYIGKNPYESIVNILLDMYKKELNLIKQDVSMTLSKFNLELEDQANILNSLKEGQTVLRNDLPIIPGNKTRH